MIITRETDYALRILRVLSDKDLHTANKIAEIEGVPSQYCYKILKKLEKSSIIQIIRGSNGGCRLLKDLTEITLYDLIKATGDDISIISCMQSDFVCTRPGKNPRCETHFRLIEVQEKLKAEMEKFTISWLLFGTKEK